MIKQVPSTDFLQRVVSSQDRVSFSQVDPYAHLSTSRYLEIFVNHRVSAPEDQAGISTLSLARDLSLGLVFQKVSLEFVHPTLLGDRILVVSWMEKLFETGFSLLGLIVGVKDKRVKASVEAEIRSVDLKTGRLVPLPSTVPCREDARLEDLPCPKDSLAGIRGIPKHFKLNV